jgi:hypothetical protein
LSDNEKTLTLQHIAGIAVRHPTLVEVGRYYGLTLASCVPADPQSNLCASHYSSSSGLRLKA